MSCHKTQNSSYTVLQPLKTTLQTGEILYLTLNQLFKNKKKKQHKEKKTSKTFAFDYMSYMTGCKNKQTKSNNKNSPCKPQYTLLSFLIFLLLTYVLLSSPKKWLFHQFHKSLPKRGGLLSLLFQHTQRLPIQTQEEDCTGG